MDLGPCHAPQLTARIQFPRPSCMVHLIAEYPFLSIPPINCPSASTRSRVPNTALRYSLSYLSFSPPALIPSTANSTVRTSSVAKFTSTSVPVSANAGTSTTRHFTSPSTTSLV